MTELLVYEGDPFAVPAFRIIAILDGDIHAERNRGILSSIYAKFEVLFGESANVTSYNFPGYTDKIRLAKPKLLEGGRSFFQRDATKYGQGIRRYGHALDTFKEPAVPFFGVEQRSYFNFLEIALPEDSNLATDFAIFAAEQLMTAPVITGAFGMGFFLPPYNDSLKFMLGRTSPRYKCAIETTPNMFRNGVRREGSAYRWKPGEEPGIRRYRLAHLHWRRVLGSACRPGGTAGNARGHDREVRQRSVHHRRRAPDLGRRQQG